jgi:hypothetical protein
MVTTEHTEHGEELKAELSDRGRIYPVSSKVVIYLFTFSV